MTETDGEIDLTDTIFIIVKSDLPIGQLPLTAGNTGEEYEFGGGWRMLESKLDVPGAMDVIAQTMSRDTKGPAIAAYASAKGYLYMVFCEKGKTVTTVLNGSHEAIAAGFVTKYKHHPLVAVGAGSGFAKKGGLKSNYDALKAAAARDAIPGVHGDKLLLTWLVGVGLPNCHDIDPYWNEIGDGAIAQRQAFWRPDIEIDINL
ncbi:hypothetical protein P3T37_003843 [Kitasatospora sp. MAA4]|uniref:hypothetical protein n=1 Tax=Kitasatospora sp. MAA4 TaxID=3035093 RepID=UPI002476B367|nr:hypothetical protein [Kitasatospora sp. MAA4]MDH6134440.1 hypothetical protein [Kitasatospora sp. MAA4]